jgi:hypothetical protein
VNPYELLAERLAAGCVRAAAAARDRGDESEQLSLETRAVGYSVLARRTRRPGTPRLSGASSAGRTSCRVFVLHEGGAPLRRSGANGPRVYVFASESAARTQARLIAKYEGKTVEVVPYAPERTRE